MKFFDRLINFVFSLAMLVVSLVILLVVFNFVDSSFVNSLLNDYVWNVDNRTVVAITSAIVFLAALKTTIFLSDFKKKRKIPIMVGTDNGNIQIASETIESTAKAVALTHEEVKEVNVKMINKTKGVNIYMSLLVSQDSNIREITRQIQEEVRDKIRETTGVIVLNTDIKVKNIIEKNKKASNVVASSEPLVVKGRLEEEDPVEEETVVEETELQPEESTPEESALKEENNGQ